MSKFSAFFQQNKVKRANIKFPVSADFVDENGNPLMWELRHFDSGENERIQRQCTKQVKMPGRTNQYREEFDAHLYIRKQCVAAVVYPDLNDAELQDSYGVMGAEELIVKMLSPGDLIGLSQKVSEMNGFERTINELVEDAKN